MQIKSLLLTFSTAILFTACGGGETTASSTTSMLDVNNYVTVAKTLYAQQDGKQTRSSITIKNLKAPNASREKNTLYISKVQKPRGYKIENMEVLYNDKKLTISVDNSFKYATISLDGSTTKVNFKEFTSSK